MEIKFLRKIGRSLLKEIPSMRLKPKTAIGIGAAGETTYLVDKRAEEIVISGLKKSGEALTIISEEIGIKEIKGGGKRVLVDPVDGSRNAISGIPFYCTSIAVANGDTLGDIESAYVVFGAISIFFTQSLSRSFDFASGWLLVREAGGIFTDIKGNSIENLEINLKRSSSLLAAGNGKLHEKALRLLSK